MPGARALQGLGHRQAEARDDRFETWLPTQILDVPDLTDDDAFRGRCGFPHLGPRVDERALGRYGARTGDAEHPDEDESGGDPGSDGCRLHCQSSGLCP
jgi:hypothetical protein